MSNNRRRLIALAAILVVGSFAGAVAAASGTSGGGPLADASQVLSPDDGDSDAHAEMNVSYEEALATAQDQLARDGNYSLTAVSAEPSAYEFEFVHQTPSTVGEAEIEVDGESDKIVESEQEYESRDGEDPIAGFEIVEGTPAPGANVTVQLTVGDEPLSGATVLLNEDAIGQTDENGTIRVTLADEDESTLQVEEGETEGELEFEFENEDDEDEREDDEDDDEDDEDEREDDEDDDEDDEDEREDDEDDDEDDEDDEDDRDD